MCLKTSKARYERLAEEGRRYIIGPMPADLFIEEFVRKDGTLSGMPDPKGAFVKLPDWGEQSQGNGKQKVTGRSNPEATHKYADEADDGVEASNTDIEGPLGYMEEADAVNSHGEAAHEQVSTAGQTKKKAKRSEEEIYEPFVRNLASHKFAYLMCILQLDAINGPSFDPFKGSLRCPRYAFLDTSARADDAGGRVGSIKPDICCYATRDMEDISVESLTAATVCTLVATFVEVKAHVDFFCDPKPGLSHTERLKHPFILDHIGSSALRKYATEALGQNIAYASEICARQFRNFCFSVSLTGHFARLIRWDRAGAIVSSRINLHTHPHVLCEFLWYFSQLTTAEQGSDLTASVALKAEERLFKDTVHAHIREQLGTVPPVPGNGGLGQHYREDCVSSIILTAQPTPVPSTAYRPRILVSLPLTSPISMFGRCTRSFWAVVAEKDPASPDGQKGTIVFLKDTWRYSGRDSDAKEGDVIISLIEKGVPNLPPVYMQEDVRVIKTKTTRKGRTQSIQSECCHAASSTMKSDETDCDREEPSDHHARPFDGRLELLREWRGSPAAHPLQATAPDRGIPPSSVSGQSGTPQWYI